MLSRAERLKKQDIPHLMRQGRTFSSPFLSLKVAPGEKGVQATVVVSSKVVPTATGRNRLKRQIRHLLARLLKKTAEPSKLIVFAKKPAVGAAASTIKVETERLLSEAKLV